MNPLKKYALFAGNPEFTRNLWQEFTLARLVVPPVVLMLMIALVVFATDSKGDDVRNRVFMVIGSVGFVLITILWGVRQAVDALMQEFSEGTWDSQRMSGLTPVQVLWGKLFGGTVAAWYVGALLLALFLYASWQGGALSVALTLKGIVALVLSAVIMHTICMSSLLAIWRKRGRQLGKGMRGVVSLPIIFVFLGIWFFSGLFRILSYRYGVRNIEVTYAQWFGLEVQWVNLLLFMLASLSVWMLIGLWQQFRSELQFRNRPWWWLGFLVFWMVMLAGFVNEQWDMRGIMTSPWHTYLLICLFFVLLTVYMRLFYERKDAMTWLRFFGALKNRERDKFLALFPSWGISLGIAVVLAVALFVWMGVSPPNMSVDNADLNWRMGVDLGRGISLFLLSLLFFVFRDVMLVLWLNLSKNNVRADGAAILYLMVFYLLLPWLAASIFDPEMAFLFTPLLSSDGESGISWLYIISPAVQVVVMAGLLFKRWQDRKGTMLN